MQPGRSLFLMTLTTALLAAVAGCSGDGNSADPAAGGGTGSGGNPPPSPPPILPPFTDAWHVPSCTSVTGAPISFTADGGLHRAPIETPAASNYFTYGVAALSGGSTLVAVVGTTTRGDPAEILFSTDAGCSWQPSGQTLLDIWYAGDAELSAAGTHAYVSIAKRRDMYVIEPTGLARPFSLESFVYFASAPFGTGIDPNDPTRVRIGLWDCMRVSCGYGSVIMETTTEGQIWTQIGGPAPYGGLAIRFSPTNLDHAITPYDSGGHVTFDGGNQWLRGQGVPTGWRAANAAIGSDGHTVWLLVEDRSNPSPTYSPPFPTAMYVSYDGGLNYQEAFAASDANPFAATNPLRDPHPYVRIFPHPSEPDIVYLAYTSRAAGTSYLYRYEAGLEQLSKREWPSAEGGVWSLAFNPADADVLYLGLAAE